jgi:hypothetical protein
MAAKEKKTAETDDTVKPSDYPETPKAAVPEDDAGTDEPTEPIRGKSYDPTLDPAPAGSDKIEPIDAPKNGSE